MAAREYQPLNVGVGPVSGPGRVAPQGAAALADQGEAIARLGTVAARVGLQIEQAQTVTRLNDATTRALTGFNELEKKYERDTGYADLAQRYNADATALTGKILAETPLDPDARSHLEQQLTRLSISAEGAVRRRAFAGEQALNVANLDTADVGFQQRYLAAASPTERASILDEQQTNVARAVAGGWIDANQGQDRLQKFRRSAEDGEALRLISSDPAAAQAALADPRRFANLDPTTRATRAEMAKDAADRRGLLEVGNLAQRAPARAALAVGKASDPVTVAAIFDKGVIPQESGGRADAVSPAGALGVGQLMPGTARMAAQRLGLADVAALPDDALRARLLSDKALNRRLGLAEFQRLVDRFDGDIPAALAGYNAGEGNAQKPRAVAWREQAIAKFGPNYTAEQFASVVNIAETRDYVLSVYRRLGAPTNAMGLSQDGRLRAQTQVATAVAGEQAQFRSLLARMATDVDANDPVADLLKGGLAVDPGRLSAYRQTQEVAAAAGDAAAVKRLRELDQAEEAAPVMAQAYRMSPADLSAAVANERSRLSTESATPAEARRLATLETVLSDVQSRAGSDPIGLAARSGAIRAEPLPVDQPLTPQFGAALATRGVQAEAANGTYRTGVMPLRPAEAQALRQWWEQAGPSDRVGLAASFATNLRGEAARSALKQVAGDDRLSFTAGTVAMRDPEVGRKVLVGAKLLEEPGVKAKITDVRAALGDVVKGQLYASPTLQRDAIEAGLAVYAANRAASAALFDPADREGIASALQEVTGKIVDINGRKTPIPPGLAPASVTRGLLTLTAADLAPFGGLGPGMDAATIAAHGQLHALELGGSRYVVTVGERPVMDASGARPLVVDLAQIGAQQQARAAQSFASPAEASDAIRRYEPVALPRSPEEASVGLPLIDPGARP